MIGKKQQHVIMTYDGKLNHLIEVCIMTLRKHSQCKIHFYYHDEQLRKELGHKYMIDFRQLDMSRWSGRRQTHKMELAVEMSEQVKIGDQVLILDCDLIFQNDPFKMFLQKPSGDFYYTTVVMSLWRDIELPVNGGVYGYVVSPKIREFLNRIKMQLVKPTWPSWKKLIAKQEACEQHNADWWIDQNMLNWIHLEKDLPFSVKKVNVGFKYNYYHSSWGICSPYLDVRRKIGNPDYAIIHLKGKWHRILDVDKLLQQRPCIADNSAYRKICRKPVGKAI